MVASGSEDGGPISVDGRLAILPKMGTGEETTNFLVFDQNGSF
jgi:hypothetical protein